MDRQWAKKPSDEYINQYKHFLPLLSKQVSGFDIAAGCRLLKNIPYIIYIKFLRYVIEENA
jgi:hypothetical protein